VQATKERSKPTKTKLPLDPEAVGASFGYFVKEVARELNERMDKLERVVKEQRERK